MSGARVWVEKCRTYRVPILLPLLCMETITRLLWRRQYKSKSWHKYNDDFLRRQLSKNGEIIAYHRRGNILLSRNCFYCLKTFLDNSKFSFVCKLGPKFETFPYLLEASVYLQNHRFQRYPVFEICQIFEVPKNTRLVSYAKMHSLYLHNQMFSLKPEDSGWLITYF